MFVHIWPSSHSRFITYFSVCGSRGRDGASLQVERSRIEAVGKAHDYSHLSPPSTQSEILRLKLEQVKSYRMMAEPFRLAFLLVFHLKFSDCAVKKINVSPELCSDSPESSSANTHNVFYSGLTHHQRPPYSAKP